MKAIDLFDYPDFMLAAPNIKFIRKLRKFRPDVVHIHTPSPLGWVGIFYAKIYKIPSIGTYHTFLQGFLDHAPLLKLDKKKKISGKMTQYYTNRFYNMCSLVTTPSETLKKQLKKSGVKARVVALSNGVDLKLFYPRKAKKEKGFIFLHVGRISYEKSIDIVINAFKELNKKEKNIRLVIVGSGPDVENLKALAKPNKDIIFKGPVPHRKLPKIYSSADAFVTASAIETEGLVILEAMACGLPTIGVNALAVPEIVEDGYNGLICRPNSAKEFEQKMRFILKNEQQRKQMIRNGLEFVKGYSLVSIMGKLEKLYKTTKAKKKKSTWKKKLKEKIAKKRKKFL